MIQKIPIVWVVTESIPVPNGGAQIRNYNLIKGLVENGFKLRVFYITGDSGDDGLEGIKNKNTILQAVSAHTGSSLSITLMGLMLRVIPYMYGYKKSSLMREMKKTLKEEVPDIIQLEQVNAYYAVEPILRDFKKSGTKIVLDEHNIEHFLLKKTLPTLPFFKKIVGYFILPNFKRIEKKAIADADLVLACSESDKAGIEKMGAKEVFLVPNGVDTNRFIPTPQAFGHSLLFMGGTTYPPNEDALRWYFDKIHSRLRGKFPDLKFYAIGSKPAEWLVRMAKVDDSIVLPGFVPDEREYLEKATVCISPMRIGSGTGLKVLSYMASAKPVVSTSVGARGIECQNGYDIEIADTADVFYEKIVNILESPVYATELGVHARSTMEKKYDWKKLVGMLAIRYTSLSQK